MLQKDFAHSSEQHRFKIRRQCAMLIQKSVRPDSIVAHFCSQAAPHRLLQQYRHEREVLPCLLCRCFRCMSGRNADIAEPTLLTHLRRRLCIAAVETMLICADGVKQSSQIILPGVSFDPNKIVSFHN
jgi:hypothetical protein